MWLVCMHLAGAIAKMHGFICEKRAIFTLCSENKGCLLQAQKACR